MAETAIVNASPLIFFSRSDHLDLLNTFANEVWVPEPVHKEILARGTKDRVINNLAFSLPPHPAQLRCLSLKYRHIPALKRLAGRAMEHRKHQVIYDPTLMMYLLRRFSKHRG